jgi:hypothetical protein
MYGRLTASISLDRCFVNIARPPASSKRSESNIFRFGSLHKRIKQPGQDQQRWCLSLCMAVGKCDTGYTIESWKWVVDDAGLTQTPTPRKDNCVTSRKSDNWTNW